MIIISLSDPRALRAANSLTYYILIAVTCIY